MSVEPGKWGVIYNPKAGTRKVQKRWNRKAGITVLVPNNDFHASKICDTFEEAVDLCVEALEKQLVKYKEKQRNK